jgi:hypothetical protein
MKIAFTSTNKARIAEKLIEFGHLSFGSLMFGQLFQKTFQIPLGILGFLLLLITYFSAILLFNKDPHE